MMWVTDHLFISSFLLSHGHRPGVCSAARPAGSGWCWMTERRGPGCTSWPPWRSWGPGWSCLPGGGPPGVPGRPLTRPRPRKPGESHHQSVIDRGTTHSSQFPLTSQLFLHTHEFCTLRNLVHISYCFNAHSLPYLFTLLMYSWGAYVLRQLATPTW